MRSIIALLLLSSGAHAVDNGQYTGAPPEIRDWFRSVRAPNGIPCCDIADGHRTTYEVRGAELWVPIEGVMTRVPPESIVQHSRNPTGDAVVWWTRSFNGVFIRCFVLPEMG